MGLMLGGIDFQLQDLPEQITGGGEQAVAVRKFPGGGIDIQVLGAFDDPIAWDGTMIFTDDSGVTAFERAQQIDLMRIQGDYLIMEYSNVYRKVIITKFKYTYLNDYHLKYEIEVQPWISYDATSPATLNGVADQTAQYQQASTTENDNSGQTATNQQTQANYTVASGDTLWWLAVKYYNDPFQWPKIADANGVKDPKLLLPGTQLTIPNPTQGLNDTPPVRLKW